MFFFFCNFSYQKPHEYQILKKIKYKKKKTLKITNIIIANYCKCFFQASILVEFLKVDIDKLWYLPIDYAANDEVIQLLDH